MSRSESTLRDLRDLRAEMRKTIRFETWNKLSYWLMQAILPDARFWIIKEVMSTSYIGEIWLVARRFQKLSTILFLPSGRKVDSQLQWSPLDRTFTAINGQFIIFNVFNQNTTRKLFFVMLTPQTVVIDFEGSRFCISLCFITTYLFGVLTTTLQFFWNHFFPSI